MTQGAISEMVVSLVPSVCLALDQKCKRSSNFRGAGSTADIRY